MAAGATYEPIATQTLASAAASITFSSIAASWTDLRLVLVATYASASSTAWMQFNGDTATNYSYTQLYGNGTTAGSSSSSSLSYIVIGDNRAGSSTTIPNFVTTDIFSYAGSTYKTALSTDQMDKNGTGSLEYMVGLWRNTTAITSIKIGNDGTNFNTGTTATLYGIKAA